MMWELVDESFGEGVWDSIEEFQYDCEQMWGFSPELNSEGKCRVHTGEHSLDMVYEGEDRFSDDEWFRNSNWRQVLEEVPQDDL